ncbi:unnamed protein product [Arctogadus glacialis]
MCPGHCILHGRLLSSYGGQEPQSTSMKPRSPHRTPVPIGPVVYITDMAWDNRDALEDRAIGVPSLTQGDVQGHENLKRAGPSDAKGHVPHMDKCISTFGM